MIATIGVLEALVLAGVGALHFYWAAGVGLPPGIPKGAARCLLLGLGAAAIVVS